jgi:hypothetical protein
MIGGENQVLMWPVVSHPASAHGKRENEPRIYAIPGE